MINTPTGSGAADGYEIRNAAVRNGIPCLTTMTGASAAARSSQCRERAEPLSLQELHGIDRSRIAERRADHAGRALRAADERVLAPFGRRRCEVVANEASGDTGLSPMDTSGRRRAPASSTCWPRTAGAARTGGPTSPRVRRRRGGGGSHGCAARLPARGSRPGHGAPEALPLGAGLHVTGPLGRPFSLRGLSPAAGAILVGGGIGSQRWRFCSESSPSGGSHSGSCSAFAIVPTRAGWISFAARRADGVRGRPHGHQGYVTDLLAGPAGGG